MRFWWLLLAMLGSCASVPRPAPRAVCVGCNVLVIAVDPLRIDHLGWYGYHRRTTPHLDKWFEHSYVMSRAFAPSGLTPQSHMSLMTSWYPDRHRVLNVAPHVVGANDRLGPGIPLLAEVLRDAGHATYWFGGKPLLQMLNGGFGFGRGMDHFVPHSLTAEKDVEMVLSHLDKRGQKPFFAFVQSWNVHTPYLTPKSFSHFKRAHGSRLPTSGHEHQAWEKRVVGKLDGGEKGRSAAYAKAREVCRENGWDHCELLNPSIFKRCAFAALPGNPRWNTKEKGALDCLSFTASYFKLFLRNRHAGDAADLSDAYDDAILYTDHLLGQVLAGLEKRGVLDNTILMFVSAHGEELPENGPEVGHLVFSEGTMRFPWLISLPGQRQFKTGRTPIHRLSSSVDVMPTLLGLLGVTAPPGNGSDIFGSDGGPRAVFGHMRALGGDSRYAADERLRYIENLWSLPECHEVMDDGRSTRKLADISACHDLKRLLLERH